MRILLLSARLPKQEGKADSFTVYYLAEYLSRRGHTIHVISFMKAGEEKHLPELNQLVSSVHTVKLTKWQSLWGVVGSLFKRKPLQVGYYQGRTMADTIKEVLSSHDVDVVYAHLIRMAEYVRHTDTKKRVLGMQISQTLNYSRLLENARALHTKLLYSLELFLVKQYEKAVIEDFDQTFLISPNDCRAITGKSEHPLVTFMPHGIDVDFFSQAPATAPHSSHGGWDIVFNGYMSVPTNVDSILWFCEAILPLIWKKRPQATLCIVGRNPTAKVRNLASDSRITVTGAVDDLRPFLHNSRVAVDPLRIGAGLQNKLLVSMAAGLASVCTSVANEGIGAPFPSTVFVADTPESFASAVLQLIDDPTIRRDVGFRAQQFVLERWTWEYHHGKWEQAVNRLIAE